MRFTEPNTPRVRCLATNSVQTRADDVAILAAVNVYRRIYKYAVATRLSHGLWVVAFSVLVSSGMQIFNAS
jgi:hypothetical protein